MPAGAPVRYLVGRLRGRDVAGVGSQVREGPVAWSTYVWVESADATAARAREAGGAVLAEPFDVLDAGRMAVLADAEGAAFSVWQAAGHRGAQLVNEAGTWNWSDLNCRDPEAARAFYGAVFGWVAQPVDFGDGGETWMWRVPGYADFLEARDPGIRERHRQGGAPEGFSDAIGWLQPLGAGQPGAQVPAHWSVTFSVDDADAIAERALELGGEVAVPPFDAGGVARVAVLRDPQGAAFTVSRYDPR